MLNNNEFASSRTEAGTPIKQSLLDFLGKTIKIISQTLTINYRGTRINERKRMLKVSEADPQWISEKYKH